MAETFQYDVFLSHSSKDKPIVRELAERLKADGLEVWFDEWEIKPGDSIPAKIEEGLEHSRVLVLCMSAHAFGSDWAQLESRTFRFRDPLNRERRFIPLRLDDAPIKGSLAQFLYINWHPKDRDQEYAKLLEACRPSATAAAPQLGTTRPRIPKRAIQLERLGSIWAYAFDPNGRWAVSNGRGTVVRLSDMASGKRIRFFKGHADDVESLALSADASQLLTGGDVKDATVRLWDVHAGACLCVLEGHNSTVHCLAFSGNGARAVSGSGDSTLRLWDIKRRDCIRVFAGHKCLVRSLAWGGDERNILTGSDDKTLRLWDVSTGRCVRVFEGHSEWVSGIAWRSGEPYAISCSFDKTLRVWEISTGRCLRVLEGHTRMVDAVALSTDMVHVLSSSDDHTVRLWEVETGRCLQVLEGHTDRVSEVTWSSDGYRAFSGDMQGGIRIWDLSVFLTRRQDVTVKVSPLHLQVEIHDGITVRDPVISEVITEQVQYTNAKVLLVGDPNAGKTGLTERLVHDRPPLRGPSTAGVWSTQWAIKDMPHEPGWEREVWLWDFAGQADQRLIHQLYLNRTALVLLMFDSDREAVLPGLREWQQALARSGACDARVFVVAGRTDVGCRFHRAKVQAFAKENGYEYFETSAETNSGIPSLRKAMLEKIPWSELTAYNSPVLFKHLKDEVLKLRDEGIVLVTFKELESILRHRLPVEIKFSDVQLDTVVTLLDGPGVVKELGFGTYILLRPEWINIYAQAVIRTLRASESGLGCLPVASVAEGKLTFQTVQKDATGAAENRLGPADEKIVLQAMEQMLLERRLCLRQDGYLVFPSHCGLERSVGPVPPKPFVSYTVRGFLDDIYATLVVKLAHCGAFKLKELWRDAADFETLAEGKILGTKLVRRDDGRGELLGHHAKGVSTQEKVIFARYIHEHLSEKSTEEVPRLRYYTCPHCDEPVKNRELAMERLEEHGEAAQIRCQRCDRFVLLWDAMEKRFASKAIKKKVAELRQIETADLDSRRQGQLLVHEVSARIMSANQKCHDIPGDEDEGIDMVVEFTDGDGQGTGKHMYLQLKAGNSHLKKRKRDGEEVFRIKKQRWVQQWIRQDGPMMLVIGTFPEDREHASESEKKSFDAVRWMEVGELLRVESQNGAKQVRQIAFKGDRLDAQSVRMWRDKALNKGEG